jgi:dihydroorotate dehydrogenase
MLIDECQTGGVNWRKYQRLALVYDVRNSFEENTNDGPHSLSSTHDPYIPEISARLLGHSLNSPLGIPACVLTIDSHWVEPFSRYGFDVITAKTVRTRRTVVHPFPNWMYLPELTKAIAVGEFPECVRNVSHAPDAIVGRVSTANSFGMPSLGPEVWQPELIRSRQVLREGQMLIASVVGTADDGDVAGLITDFVRCARLANESRPHAIELNFSCPNVYGQEGSLCRNPEIAAKICELLDRELGGTPLLIKIGYLPPGELRHLFMATYKYAHGFTAINTIPARIVSCAQREEPAFPGSVRAKAGISGVAIKDHANAAIRELRSLADVYKAEIEIIGVGGVSCADDVREKVEAGANVVQMCTAVNSNPFIAQEIRQEMASRIDPRAAAKVFGHSVAFTDSTVLAAFESTAKACEGLRVPFEVGLQALTQNWLTGYLSEIQVLKTTTQSGFRTRRESPKQEQISDWIKSSNRNVKAKAPDMGGTNR